MPPLGDRYACSRRAQCSSWECKERGVSGLTIRSSRARFAASALAGYDFTIANAAQRPGLAQALDRSRNKCRSTSVMPNWRLSFSCLAQASEPRHKLRAGKNAGTPFLGLACTQKAVVGAVLGPRATAGTGLTIRSSRDRFAASCKSANFHLHKAAKRPVLTQALDRRRQDHCQKQLA